MPLGDGLLGRAFSGPATFVVTREHIAEFAAAIGSDDPQHFDPAAAAAAGHPDVVAPPTYPIVVAFPALQAMLADPEVDIELSRVVHAEQGFTASRPLHAGDQVTARLEVVSLRRAAGTDLIGTRTTIRTADGEPVCVADATLAHRRADPAP